MDPGGSLPWIAGLLASGLLYAFAAFASAAFRVLSPVTVEALVERAGPQNVDFLRKSLRSPGAFWLSLTLASSGTMLLCLVVLFAARLSVGVGPVVLHVHPTGTLLNDVVLFVLLMTVVASVELVLPVIVARIDPVRFVERSLPAMRGIHAVFSPLTSLLESWTAETVEETPSSPEDLMAYIDVGTREGILDRGEGKLLHNLVTFGETRVYEVMTPRTDVVGIEVTATVDDVAALMARSRFSRIPVHRGQLDDVAGIAGMKDVLDALREGRSRDPVTSLMRPPYLVPESKRVSELLPEFQSRREQMAIVVDEYGGTAGLVSMEDLLEELVGEIREEHEQPGEDLAAADDGSWIARGRASLHDVGATLGADLELADASTVGGLVMALFERVPTAGEVAHHAGYGFEVLQADRRRVQRVRITLAPDRPASPPQEGEAVG